MHDHIIHRFRDRTRQYYKNKTDFTPLLQVRLRHTARRFLSLLTRANEGFIKPLEKVLLSSYGRIGRRRHELLHQLLNSTIPANTEALEALVSDSRRFGDTWTPPPILVELLKAQRRSATIVKTGLRPIMKTLQPEIPKENSWGRPMPKCRQRNLRLKWYRNALNSALPPLPITDINILDDLMSRKLPWKARPRRRPFNDQDNPTRPQPLLTPQFLAEGPARKGTFRQYKDGRPHQITNRFMQRLWDRINCLIPRTKDTNGQNQISFTFPTQRSRPDAIISLTGTHVKGLFDGLDEKGRRVGHPTESHRVRPQGT